MQYKVDDFVDLVDVICNNRKIIKIDKNELLVKIYKFDKLKKKQNKVSLKIIFFNEIF